MLWSQPNVFGLHIAESTALEITGYLKEGKIKALLGEHDVTVTGMVKSDEKYVVCTMQCVHVHVVVHLKANDENLVHDQP